MLPNRVRRQTSLQMQSIRHLGQRFGIGPEFVKFCLVGGLNTVTAIAIIWIAMKAGLGTYVSNAAGYAVGISLSYLLNAKWTFEQAGGFRLSQVGRFLAGVAAAYACNLAVVTAVCAMGINPYLAQLAGLPAYTLAFYVISRRFVFRETPATTDPLHRT